MNEIAAIRAAGLLLTFGFETVASAMGGQGGPSDRWGSPYALIAPQSFPSDWTNQEKERMSQGSRQPPANPRPAHAKKVGLRK
jgi:hypothetical protein